MSDTVRDSMGIPGYSRTEITVSADRGEPFGTYFVASEQGEQTVYFSSPVEDDDIGQDQAMTCLSPEEARAIAIALLQHADKALG